MNNNRILVNGLLVLIVCHAHDEQSVCLSVAGRKAWYPVTYDRQGYGWAVVQGKNVLVFA